MMIIDSPCMATAAEGEEGTDGCEKLVEKWDSR